MHKSMFENWLGFHRAETNTNSKAYSPFDTAVLFTTHKNKSTHMPWMYGAWRKAVCFHIHMCKFQTAATGNNSPACSYYVFFQILCIFSNKCKRTWSHPQLVTTSHMWLKHEDYQYIYIILLHFKGYKIPWGRSIIHAS